MEKWKRLGFVYFFTAALCCALALLAGDAATAFAEGEALPRRATVVIDPGHGGEDGGAVSCTGVQESAVNLAVSLRLDALLRFLGYDTVLVRDSDTAIYSPGARTLSEKKVSDLKNRVALVNATPGALLLSVHQNQFPDGKYAGAQVFYAATPGSRELAEAMQGSFAATVNPGSRRRCKEAGSVYLMQHVHCTAVLVECGFLSNPAEEAKLREPGYQQRIACVIGTAAAAYLAGAQE